jgi:outer membrane protein
VTLDWCVATALASHPDITVARSAADAQMARVGQARAAYYPQLAAHAGYWRDNAIELHDYSATTSRSSTIKDGDDYNASVSLGIVLLDFGRRSGTVAASELQLEAARLDVEATLADLELAVRMAFFDTLKLRRAREVQAATVKQYEEHLGQAQAFYEAGTKPRYDVTKAEVDVSNVKLALGDVDNALRVAWVNLATLVGFDSSGEPLIAETPAPEIAPTTPMEAAATAYASRPELAVARKLAEAAERTLAAAKADFYPYLTGAATYTWDGPEESASTGASSQASRPASACARPPPMPRPPVPPRSRCGGGSPARSRASTSKCSTPRRRSPTPRRACASRRRTSTSPICAIARGSGARWR